MSDWIICFPSGEVEYSDRFHNRGVIAWLDNEAARFAASKGTAQSTTLIAMARVLQQLEITCPSVIWVERVCSFSNPSDLPSRSQCRTAADLFAAKHVEAPIRLGNQVLNLVHLLSKDIFSVIPELPIGSNRT